MLEGRGRSITLFCGSTCSPAGTVSPCGHYGVEGNDGGVVGSVLAGFLDGADGSGRREISFNSTIALKTPGCGLVS